MCKAHSGMKCFCACANYSSKKDAKMKTGLRRWLGAVESVTWLPPKNPSPLLISFIRGPVGVEGSQKI